jgi:hypothetical protein
MYWHAFLLFDFRHARLCGFHAAGGWDYLACLGEAEWRHVDVDALVLALADRVRLMEDADRAVVAYGAIKGSPCGQVGFVAGVGIGIEVVNAAPILERHDGATAKEGLYVQEAKVWLSGELFEHARHGLGDGEPLVDLPEAVDAHADEEDGEVAFDLGGVTAWEDWHDADILEQVQVRPSAGRAALRAVLGFAW